MTVYQPAEDTLFLLDYLKEQEVSGTLLEIGTGSGKIAVEMSKKGWDVTATDIDPEAVKATEKRAREEEADLNVFESDLFEKVEEEYDVIVFNPPYLPGEEMEDDETWRGGERGIELTERFLSDVSGYLADGGRAIFIASSLAELDEIEHDLNVLDETNLWFETLYILEFK